jgi:hypothetical protein
VAEHPMAGTSRIAVAQPRNQIPEYERQLLLFAFLGERQLSIPANDSSGHIAVPK